MGDSVDVREPHQTDGWLPMNDIQAKAAEFTTGLYDAATDNSSWNDVARGLAGLMDSHQSILWLKLSKQPGSEFLFTHGLESVHQELYVEMLEEDIWLRGMRLLPSNSVCRSEQFIDLTELRKTAFYRELCVPANVAHMGGAVLRNSPESITGFAAQRSVDRGVFTDSELQLLQGLNEHFSRAVFLYHTVGKLRHEVATLRLAVDRINIATYLMDEVGRLDWCNTIGEKLLREQDGLRVKDLHLCALNTDQDRALQRLIELAAETTSGRGLSSGGSVAVSRPSGKLPYRAMVCPLGRPERKWGHGAMAAVFVTDPEAPPAMSLESLAGFYRLTPAECRVCELLLQGFSLNEAADMSEISINTIRTQLKSVFRKCRVSSQAQLLLRLVNTGSGILVDEDLSPERRPP